VYSFLENGTKTYKTNIMKIEKLDLKKLGFKKNHVTACESGDKPYDYYTLNIGKDYTKFCLITNPIEKDKDIQVEIFDYTSFVFTETTELTLLINILKNNYERQNKTAKRKKLCEK